MNCTLFSIAQAISPSTSALMQTVWICHELESSLPLNEWQQRKVQN
ncbi:MAG: hypothetical protein J6T00_07815 [Bacteroidaceae bacterium]|nr:hypothetical protein [Bacteroidaceae bacterium]